MDAEQHRPRVTIVLDADVCDAVERVAERERGSLSGVSRRVLSEWAASRERAQAAA